MRYGYRCEECEEAAWPATTRAELVWLRSRRHIVREVLNHTGGGLDSWIMDGIEFLDAHDGHSVAIVSRP